MSHNIRGTNGTESGKNKGQHELRSARFFSTRDEWHKWNVIQPDGIRRGAIEVATLTNMPDYVKVPMFYTPPVTDADLLFNVMTPNPEPVQLDNLLGIYRLPGDGLPGAYVGNCSPNYEIVGPMAIARQWDANVFESDGITPRHVETMGLIGSRNGDKDTFFLSSYFGRQNDPFGDEVQLFLTISADMSGTGAIELLPTETRVVCANTHAWMLDNATARWKVSHYKGAEQNLGKWLSTISNMTEEAFREMASAYDRMAAYHLTDEELTRIMEESFALTPFPAFDRMMPDDIAEAKYAEIERKNKVMLAKQDFARDLFNGQLTGYRPEMAGTAYAAWLAGQEVAQFANQRDVQSAYRATLVGNRREAIANVYTAVMAVVDQK